MAGKQSSCAVAESLRGLACPNPECGLWNRFGAGNLSVSDWIGKNRAIRRLDCSGCGKRFSERKGAVMQEAKLPEETVVRIIKCLVHGCSVEATADICEVDARTVERYWEYAGKRTHDFHQQQLERMPSPLEAAELDELHTRVARPLREKRGTPAKPARMKKRRRREMGKNGVHAAIASTSRFVIDLRVGPRTKETAVELVGSVTLCGNSAAVRPCGGSANAPPLFLVDDHLPYPSAILEVYGQMQHRRRRTGRGRRKHPRLKPSPGLLAGVVKKLRDAGGNLLRVARRGLFGSKPAVIARIQELGIGETIHTAHVERLNGTLRGQQARLSRRRRRLQWSLWLWRDWYNWVRPHRSLNHHTPAMAQRLADRLWSVCDDLRCPVHVDDLQRALWADDRQIITTSALNDRKRLKVMPTS